MEATAEYKFLHLRQYLGGQALKLVDDWDIRGHIQYKSKIDFILNVSKIPLKNQIHLKFMYLSLIKIK